MTVSVYLIDPVAHATFSAANGTKADLARGDCLFLGLNCFEPGQHQRVHRHDRADKFYLIVSGKARMAVGEDVFEAGPGSLVWAPAGVPHGVLEVHEHTVMIVGLSPPPG
ncbi:MAG: cupin domain-containing protein [Gemmatimonadetes bacterium]|nr:cupin domain-containing protein [Gemmatimonadota bacterium]